jgi:hypothetical protein
LIRFLKQCVRTPQLISIGMTLRSAQNVSKVGNRTRMKLVQY